MATHVGKKFSWVIKDSASLQSEKCLYSDPVLIGDCKWRLHAYPKGTQLVDYFSLHLGLADSNSLPFGWGRYVRYRLTILSQVSKETVRTESHRWFSKVYTSYGFPFIIRLTKLLDKDEGFLVNGELTIVAEVDVLEVIGTLDASEKSKESSRPLKKTKLNDDCSIEFRKEASSVKESMVVNGFQVLPSQVETVRRIFERHPDIAVDFRANSQYLRKIALTYLKEVNFKVDWLEKKLDQVKENKEKEQSALAELQELDALVEEQKAKLLASRITLSFDDVV